MLGGRREDLAFPFREALLAIKLNPGPNLLSVASIALCLILLGFVIAGWQNLDHLVQLVRSEAEITVYLEDRTGEEEIGSAAVTLASQPGVLGVNQVTKEQALTRMRELLGKEADILEAFEGTSPFAAYLEVRVVPEHATGVAEAAARLPGVEAVRENREVLARLVSLARAVVWVGVAVAAATGIVAMVVISHIVRLGIHARREEIETLRLLGATEWLVQAPFVAEGAILGGLGGLVSILFMGALYPLISTLLGRSLPFIPLAPWGAVLVPLSLALGLLGLGCGILGSVLAVRPAFSSPNPQPSRQDPRAHHLSRGEGAR